MLFEPAELPPLAEFVDWRELRAMFPEIFPTEYSLQWFIRRHQQQLAAGGSIIHITGRLRAHPQRFSQVAVQIGQRSAPRRHSTHRLEDVL